MIKFLIKVIIIIVLLAIVSFFIFDKKAPQIPASEISYSGENAVQMIRIDAPKPGEIINSPLMITGQARGGWYFEASFPIFLTNWDGLIIAQGHAEARGEWMTEGFVPFVATLEFIKPPFVRNGSNMHRGSLILKNDNPSGEPLRDKAAEMPVLFYPISK